MFKSSIVLFVSCVGLSTAQAFTEDYYVDQFFGSTEYIHPDVQPGKYLVFIIPPKPLTKATE